MNVMQNEVKETHEWAARCRSVVQRALDCLLAGRRRQKTLHRLRTHLRRLQAYLELMGEARNAQIMAKCVSRLSSLRTMQVMERYLTQLGAPSSDVRKVKDCIRRRQAKLDRKQIYRKIDRCVRHHALLSTQVSANWMAERMERLRREHAAALQELIEKAMSNPRRKTLHVLRLKIKSIRYQEEWALSQAYAKPSLVSWLERAQSVLGDYEERAQFRKLARALDLQSYPTIVKDWRRARACARALPGQLTEIIEALAGRRLRLVESKSPSTHATARSLGRALSRGPLHFPS